MYFSVLISEALNVLIGEALNVLIFSIVVL